MYDSWIWRFLFFHENLQTLVSVPIARIDISPSQEKLLYAACSEQERIRKGD